MKINILRGFPVLSENRQSIICICHFLFLKTSGKLTVSNIQVRGDLQNKSTKKDIVGYCNCSLHLNVIKRLQLGKFDANSLSLQSSLYSCWITINRKIVKLYTSSLT